jgi:hypothetical protein
MTAVAFSRWEIESNSAITRELYSRVQSGAPETCGCLSCVNFAAARGQIYPRDVIRLFDLLGIARDMEAEVYHTHRIGPGKHHYGGWFHLVGRIVSGSDAAKQIATNAWGFDLEKISGEFELGFTNRIGLLRDHFKGHPIVQLEFQAVVPWLLADPEPIR